MSANDRAGTIQKWFLPLRSAVHTQEGGWGGDNGGVGFTLPWLLDFSSSSTFLSHSQLLKRHFKQERSAYFQPQSGIHCRTRGQRKYDSDGSVLSVLLSPTLYPARIIFLCLNFKIISIFFYFNLFVLGLSEEGVHMPTGHILSLFISQQKSDNYHHGILVNMFNSCIWITSEESYTYVSNFLLLLKHLQVRSR